MERENEDLGLLPGAIIDRLCRDDRSVSAITPEADRAVLAEARSHFASRPSARAGRFRGPVWGAIAATIVLGMFLMNTRQQAPAPTVVTTGDLDGSGRVDIVDVLTLARMRERDPASIPQAQIDALAMRIVSLDAHGDAS